jgi:hypothetical protein
MDVIDTYHEVRFDGCRNYELYADRVVVKGKQSLGQEFESVVMLSTLQPIVSKVRARSKGFGQGIAMALVAGVLVQSGLVSPVSYWGGFVIVLGISGVLLTLATAKKVEWAYINTKAGVLALTIARSGKEKTKFESFVQSLIKQVQAIGQEPANAVT